MNTLAALELRVTALERRISQLTGLVYQNQGTLEGRITALEQSEANIRAFETRGLPIQEPHPQNSAISVRPPQPEAPEELIEPPYPVALQRPTHPTTNLPVRSGTDESGGDPSQQVREVLPYPVAP